MNTTVSNSRGRGWLLVSLMLIVALAIVVVVPRGTIIPQEAIDSLLQTGQKVHVLEVEPDAWTLAEPAPPPPPGNNEPCFTSTSIGTKQFLGKISEGVRLFLFQKDKMNTYVRIAGEVAYFAYGNPRYGYSMAQLPKNTFELTFKSARGSSFSTKISFMLNSKWGWSYKITEKLGHDEMLQRLGWNGQCK